MSGLRFSMVSRDKELRELGLFSWQDQASVLADAFSKDTDVKRLLTPVTYDKIQWDRDSRMEDANGYGDYVTTEAFEELGEKFLLALELIQLMEANL